MSGTVVPAAAVERIRTILDDLARRAPRQFELFSTEHLYRPATPLPPTAPRPKPHRKCQQLALFEGERLGRATELRQRVALAAYIVRDTRYGKYDVSARESRYAKATDADLRVEINLLLHALVCVRSGVLDMYGSVKDEKNVVWLMRRLEDLLAYRAGTGPALPPPPRRPSLRRPQQR